ncbi:unnamed protein product [Peronospora destructor]|uniref:Decapping nuclease n=1 Tax=Peronospora destructor TaxID=86335 RepID=A0AAV0V7J4_9STRA|nr:unnamed protein product [Peronospora destructor]
MCKKAEVGANVLDGFEAYTSKDEMDPTASLAPIGSLVAALEHCQGEDRTIKQPRFITYRNNLNKIMDMSTSSGGKERKVNEDEEFCSISSMMLSDKRLVIAAEIDCCGATQGSICLRTLQVIGILDLIVFGGHSEDRMCVSERKFQAQKLQSFRSRRFLIICRKHWSPVVCLNFTKMLLDWICAQVEEGCVHLPRQQVVENALSSEPSFLLAQN